MKKRVVLVSTQYTGTKKRLGQWIRPKKYVVHVKDNWNTSIYAALKKKPSLKRKEFTWWDYRK